MHEFPIVVTHYKKTSTATFADFSVAVDIHVGVEQFLSFF